MKTKVSSKMKPMGMVPLLLLSTVMGVEPVTTNYLWQPPISLFVLFGLTPSRRQGAGDGMIKRPGDTFVSMVKRDEVHCNLCCPGHQPLSPFLNSHLIPLTVLGPNCPPVDPAE